jgi:glutaminase
MRKSAQGKKMLMLAFVLLFTLAITSSLVQAQAAPAVQQPVKEGLKVLPGGKLESATIQKAVQEAYEKFKDLQEGKNADYIPELAKIPSELFGVAVVTNKGEVVTAGDVNYAFTIQSVSKPFTAALVMQEQGDQALKAKIGVEPTGLPFNSILATQIIPQISVNPLVNSGAIASVSLVKAANAEERFKKIIGFFERLAADKLTVIEEVYKSEAATNQNNRAHAYILFARDRIYSEPMEAVDVYTRQCSIGVTAKQLAVMGATLANNGVNPINKDKVLDGKYIPKVLAVMMMAGFYNESGAWAFDSGLPAKTGVGGGIVAVVPAKMAIVGFSPRLNEAGNSIRATKAINYIAEKLGYNIFSGNGN